MRSRAQVYGTTDIRANEEGAMQQRAAPGQRSPQGNEPRRPGQCADATADRTSTPFQTSEHRPAFSAAARRQCDNQKSTTSPFLNAEPVITRGAARCVRGHVDDSAHVQNFGYACGAHCAPGGFA